MKRFLLAAALSVAAFSASTDTSVAAEFDGNWSVLIVTEQGQCDRAYRYPVRIANGDVTYGGKKNFNVSGQVAKGGVISVTVSQGNQAAVGKGSLRGKYGTGTWQAPSGGCSGKWQAERRG